MQTGPTKALVGIRLTKDNT